MNDFLIYQVHVTINLIIFYIFFWLFFRKDKNHTINRFYLLLSLVISVLVPLLDFKIPVSSANTFFINLDSVTISDGQIARSISERPQLKELVWLIYILVTGVFVFRFLTNIFMLGYLIVKNETVKTVGIRVVKTKRSKAVFSFLNYVFIDQKIIDNIQYDKILAHEQIHIKQYHTIDLIFLELLTIIQWFNPVVWLYRYSVKNIHEYLADEGVINAGISKADYQNMLITQTFSVNFSFLTNNFSHSLIKRRFIMMSKISQNNTLAYKTALIAPLALVIVLFFSVSFTTDLIAQESKDKTIVKTESTANDNDPQKDEVFVVVEKMPEYPGGEDARTKFLVENIKYPEEARKKGVEGTVYITFIVEKDGKITDIKILRGIGSGCDEEAMRVIALMPDWKPGEQRGKPIRFQFNMPIKFSLQKNEKKPDVLDPEKK